MKRWKWILAALGLCGGIAVWAQSPVSSPVFMDSGGTRLDSELLDAGLGQRPLAREDAALKAGRDLRQGEAVVNVHPPAAEASASDPRVRAKATLQEDRARVKREAALQEVDE